MHGRVETFRQVAAVAKQVNAPLPQTVFAIPASQIVDGVTRFRDDAPTALQDVQPTFEQFADDPLTCVARGTGLVLQELSSPAMERVLVAETYSRPPR